MKMNLFANYVLLGLLCLVVINLTSATTTTTTTNKDTKEKRQIYHTRVLTGPQNHQQQEQLIPDNEQLETVYGAHPNQYVIRAVNPSESQLKAQQLQEQQGQIHFRPQHQQNKQQQQQQHHQHYVQQKQQTNIPAEQPQELFQQQYIFTPQIVHSQQQDKLKTPTKKVPFVRPVHYQFQQELQPQQSLIPYQDRQYQKLLSEEQILKLLQDEIARSPQTSGIIPTSTGSEEKPNENVQIEYQALLPVQLQQQHQQQQQNSQSQRQQKVLQRKGPTQKVPQNTKSGLGSYRDAQDPESSAALYTFVPQQQLQPQHIQQQQQHIHQQFYAQPINYHRGIPDHPLAASSLEKELEKLVASNKPTSGYQQQSSQLHYQRQPQQLAQEIYTGNQHIRPQAVQQKQYSPSVPVIQESQTQIQQQQQPKGGFSFFPDFAQLSGFTGPSFPTYEQAIAPAPKKTTGVRNNGQHLTETSAQSHVHPSSPTITYKTTKSNAYQHESTQHQQQKVSSHFVPIIGERSRNSNAKFIDSPPPLKYEKVAITPAASAIVSRPTPPVNHYYKTQNRESLEQKQQQQQQQSVEPSRSSIFVSQATGIRAPQISSPVKINGEKTIKIPPQDGKPITQEEFQALVDAGYPVTAVPVPVPVPYDAYYREQENSKESLVDPSENQLRQVKDASRHGITYLHPISLEQQQQQQQQQLRQQYQHSHKINS